METVVIDTRDGPFTAYFADKGLVRLELPGQDRSARAAKARARDRDRRLEKWVALTEKALHTILAGKPSRAFPPVDFSQGTAFQREVWAALLAIPMGETRTYGQIAAVIDRPRAVRAVGQACGANPIPVLVPCHRVLASGGKIGGFSAGLKWKRELLAKEGVRVGFGFTNAVTT
jgi:O-6-methylguanine DNA methyltransferase